MKNIGRYKILFISLALPQVAGFIGSVVTTPAITTWYIYLSKPGFNPPNWIFGPVWTILYILMGISLYLIWRKGTDKKMIYYAVKIFIFHLFFNILWSIVFFGFRNLGFAILVILILWVMIFYLIALFWKIDKKASVLLIPYFAWVSFASILNYFVWRLN